MVFFHVITSNKQKTQLSHSVGNLIWFFISLMLIIPSYVSSREGWAVTVITDNLVVHIFAYNIMKVASRDNPYQQQGLKMRLSHRGFCSITDFITLPLCRNQMAFFSVIEQPSFSKMLVLAELLCSSGKLRGAHLHRCQWTEFCTCIPKILHEDILPVLLSLSNLCLLSF